MKIQRYSNNGNMNQTTSYMNYFDDGKHQSRFLQRWPYMDVKNNLMPDTFGNDKRYGVPSIADGHFDLVNNKYNSLPNDKFTD